MPTVPMPQRPAARASLRPAIGNRVDELCDGELTESIYYTLFPNFHPWGAYNRIVYRFRPYGNDHRRSIMECMFLSPFVGERPPAAPIHWLADDDDWTDATELERNRPIDEPRSLDEVTVPFEGEQSLGNQSGEAFADGVSALADLFYGLGDTHAAGSLDHFEQIPLCLAELIKRLVQCIHSLAKRLCLAMEHE